MKLSYKVTNRPIITTSQLLRSDLKSAMFYVYKEDDITSFEVTTINPELDLSSAIYKSENLKTVFKVNANTTDIMVTNISVEGTPYYYEIKSSNNSVLSLTKIVLNTNLEVIELNGRLLTNTYINNYEISDGIFIYSVPIIDSGSYNVKYYSDSILLSIPKTKDQTLYAKPRLDTSLTVSKITDNSILLSSFYVKSRSNISQFIEGDVVLLDKKELTTIENNFIKLKDKAVSVKKEGYLNTLNNLLYIEDTYLTAQDVVVEYTAKRSSHIFEIDSKVYLKLINNSLVVSSSFDCDVIITKKVDASKIHVETNDFLNKHEYELIPENYGFIFNSVLEENKRKMFTKYIDRTTYLNPSEQVYLQIDDKIVYQEEYSSDFKIGIISKDFLYQYLEEDYAIPIFEVINKQLDKVAVESLYKSYFTKHL